MTWVAVILTVLGLWLAGKKDIWCWPVWIVGDILWIVAMVPQAQWAVVAVNVIFLGMNVKGWWEWKHQKPTLQPSDVRTGVSYGDGVVGTLTEK